MRKQPPRIAGIVAAVIGLVLVGAGPAAAHVTIDTAEPVGGGAVRVTFGFNHACADSPTAALATALPVEAVAESVTPPTGWTGEIDGDTVAMTGPPIPGDRQIGYSITVRLTGQVGQALLFPTVQTCASGEALDWTDADEAADAPAPRLIATAAILDRVIQPAAGKAGGASPLAVAAAVAVFVGLAAALAAIRTRRRGSPIVGGDRGA